MKVLIYGLRGYIGTQISDFFINQNIEVIEGKSRCDNDEELEKEITNINPTHVISCVGRTHGYIGDKYYANIDYLEYNLNENIRDNLFAPMMLATICTSKNIHFTNIGTACIFEYDDNLTLKNGVKEETLPNFFGSSYSIVKGYQDRLMKKFNILNLRIRMPITSENNSRNLITKLANYSKICSHPNSMSVLPSLLPYLLQMIKNDIRGTFNFTNPGYISHNEILELYKQYVDPEKNWQNISDAEQGTILVSRRSNTFLDTSKLTSLFPDVPNIKEAVIECLKKYSK